jgi:hypothetical protein
VLRPQRATGEPSECGLVAQVDLRRDARVREAGARVEPSDERGLGEQAELGDDRGELTHAACPWG